MSFEESQPHVGGVAYGSPGAQGRAEVCGLVAAQVQARPSMAALVMSGRPVAWAMSNALARCSRAWTVCRS